MLRSCGLWHAISIKSWKILGQNPIVPSLPGNIRLAVCGCVVYQLISAGCGCCSDGDAGGCVLHLSRRLIPSLIGKHWPIRTCVVLIWAPQDKTLPISKPLFCQALVCVSWACKTSLHYKPVGSQLKPACFPHLLNTALNVSIMLI